MRWLFTLLFLGALAARADIPGPPLLRLAADKWLEEGDRWAFAVKIQEFDKTGLKEERVERYDPSKPGMARWELVEINGQPPTDDRRDQWSKRKTKKHKSANKTLADYFDFENAKIASVTATDVKYHLPLKTNRGWLFPVDRVNLLVSVNKKSHEIEQIEANIDEPFRVALGLAQILDLDLDLKLGPANGRGPAAGPETAQPAGEAHAVVHRFGERIEYSWSDFQRVVPDPSNLSAL